jgi:3-isopropylmalate/(R)-2-methylmalate dehydratase small subunit
MQSFIRLNGVVAPLDRVNVDTDQIIPKQFLKRIERSGFGQFLFFDWRLNEDGTPNKDFELKKPGYENSEILISGRNFGSGSSREHAPWALLDYGFKCILAPSFADIFFNNCFQNGILPITLPEHLIERIMSKSQEFPGYKLTIDLESQRIWDEDEEISTTFEVEPFRRHLLLNGLDDIGLTLEHEKEIEDFESHRSQYGGVVSN